MTTLSTLNRHIHHKNVSNLSDSMVWYNMFIIFVMYCMLPVPVKWCTVCCLLTAIIHIIVLAALVKQSEKRQKDGSIINQQPNPVWNVFSIGLLYLGKPFRLYLFMIKHWNGIQGHEKPIKDHINSNFFIPFCKAWDWCHYKLDNM